MIAPTASAMPPVVWPPSGSSVAGMLVDAAATANGLIALAFGTSDGKGKVVILIGPTMEMAREIALESRPQTLHLYQPKGGYVAHLAVAFEGGGIESWELPPADEAPVEVK